MVEPRPIRPVKAERRRRRCPICSAAAVARWRPFCSQRCADADLTNWLSGGYRIPSAGEDGADDDAEGSEGDPRDE
ncbi:MAG: DNA gyrase inhibitor YacG [Rhodospirillales bacterium]|nr:DNA gyrase inhibitor YacG [Rhodospirillales bacterium]